MSSMRASFSGIGSGMRVVGAHGVDDAPADALLAGAVVGQDQDQRVVAHGRRLEEGDQPRQVLVGVVEHGGVGALQAAEHRLLVGAQLVPGTTPSLRGGRRVSGRHDAHRLLPRQPALALGVPAVWNTASYFRIRSRGAWCGAWQAPSATQVSHGVSGRRRCGRR